MAGPSLLRTVILKKKEENYLNSRPSMGICETVEDLS
jgi:hypothetical protein